eukprot:TRINITY_DN10253_c0_g1_i2.p1 TRINITY_DN10253_c0_g1~~TRINITY_DN10253_c0_g1_i2.p1  ORF type:complete len:415 (+),score=65.78 TRINITY_DN10253_c0_g1_i2:163-1407(+)
MCIRDRSTWALDSQQSLCFYANMLETAMTDGVLKSEEQQMLRDFGKHMNIDADAIAKVWDVLLIKNQLSVLEQQYLLREREYYMKKIIPLMLSGILMFFVAICFGAAPDTVLFSGSAVDEVYFVPQFSDFKEISFQDMLFLKKILAKAQRDNIKAVIVELDTPGGQVDVALKYVSMLSKSAVPVIVYLNPQGISAGMIIALGANRIAINPHGVIGDAMPMQIGMGGVRPVADDSDVAEKEKEPLKDTPAKKVEKEEEKKKPSKDTSALEKILEELKKSGSRGGDQQISEKDKRLADQKFLTVYFKVLQVLAEKNGRPVRVIRAMADPYQKLTVKEDGILHDKVSPLTLSAAEAKKTQGGGLHLRQQKRAYAPAWTGELPDNGNEKERARADHRLPGASGSGGNVAGIGYIGNIY